MVLTGKRGGFGAMKPMLRLMRDDPEIELQLVVTDQHVSDRFGRTEQEVRQEFEIAAAVDMRQADASPYARAAALGNCLSGMAETMAELRPDICVLYGDRGEVAAAALAATTLNIPIAHLQGGDVSGSLDEPMRHAVTKLAHLHFPSTEASAERIRKMGEEAWRVHRVGDSHLDPILAGEYRPRDEVLARFKLDPEKPILVVLQHSETTAPGASYDQMRETLEAVRETGHQTVLVHPCSDAGFDGIVRAIDELAAAPQFRVFVNLDAPWFWGLLSVASVLVGNSSAGLIETPSFRLPAVNVGRRQIGRACAENVLHVEHDRAAILAAISNALSPEFRAAASVCGQPFGDGQAGRRVHACLRDIPLDRKLLLKRLSW
jgi:UDP-N-acetylglucosamine 2-epimerase (non-hydrolysing)/GDP/UDP-N,N'-diacetylbacillosamine 2-epimerase (hydrolysing)